MEIGQKCYRISHLQIKEYKIVKITDSHITLRELESIEDSRSMKISYFEQFFSLSKIYLLRELLHILEERKDEVVAELGEYDLKCMTGEIIPPELLKNLK